jgi:hypothetical protein
MKLIPILLSRVRRDSREQFLGLSKQELAFLYPLFEDARDFKGPDI